MVTTQRDKEVSELRKSEEAQELAPNERWMIWPKPPTLFELYKGLTKAHVKQVRDAQYLCKQCNAMRHVTYRYAHFNRINKGSAPVESKHLGAFCRQCNYRVRFVRDTPARWQVMNEVHMAKRDAIRAKSGRNDGKKPKRGRRK
jgi:hypothetical protein